ncbi:Peptide deformylase [bacterium HR40]|nr:Peptide deformylase [bacterium HR40]
MAVLDIAKIGHPVLLRRAEPVGDPTTGDIRRLVADMRETLEEARGLGLAAPQVRESLRILLARPVGKRETARQVPPLVLVDPVVEPLGEEMEMGLEGCLSIPSLRGLVPRYRRVRYRAVDEQGEAVEGEAEGLFARILQHEIDHLDGILFLMRMPDLRYLSVEEQLERFLAEVVAPESRK